MKCLIVFLLLAIQPFMAMGSLWAQSDVLKFNHITVDNGLPQNTVFSIVKDKYGFMWFATWGGAVRYDGYRFQVFRANENDTLSLPDNQIGYILTDSLQNIWVQAGDFENMYRFKFESETFERVPFAQVPLNLKTLMQPREGGTPPVARNKHFEWRSMNNKLVQINRQTNSQVNYQPDRQRKFALSDNIINSIYLDDQHNLWIGTQNGGVNHASLIAKPFNFEHASPNGMGLIDNVVRAVCKDTQGRIWVGTENRGITIIEPSAKGNTYRHVDKLLLRNIRIRYLYCDKKGNVWIGTKGGLFCYHKQTQTFVDCSAGICNPNVFSVFEDSKGLFWVGTFDGLAIYNRESKQYQCMGETVVKGRQIRAIIEDKNQNLWVATEDAGLTQVARKIGSDGQYFFEGKYYSHQKGINNSPLSNRIFSLAKDDEGMIWMATNAGLSRLNPTDESFKHFTIKNGLPDDVTMGVLFDGKGSVWVSHKKGLTRLNTATYDMQNFNVNDGLQGNEFNQNACFQDMQTGELFFCGNNGVNSFFPDSIQVNNIKPKPAFTRLSIMGQFLRPGADINGRVPMPQSLLCSNNITLTWHDKIFAIEFSALHFTNPQGNKYKFKLEGYDKQWHHADASLRLATYAHLPDGKYLFKLMAANSDGVWCDYPATLQITILPPWWLTWWAWLGYFIFSAAMIWLVLRYAMSQLELKRKEGLHREKLRFFTDVSHEFRTPLTLIVDPLEKLIKGEIEPHQTQTIFRLMHRNAHQLLQLINQLLDFRKLESGHLNLQLQNENVVAFVRGIASSFETAAIDKKIRYGVYSDDEAIYICFDAAKLQIIMNNLLSNAFKFTPAQGEISVRVEAKDEGVNIKVSDTGIGIAKHEQLKVFGLFYQSSSKHLPNQGSGIGLTLTNELVKLHGGFITLESEPHKGTCFTVWLPKGRVINGENSAETSEIRQVLVVDEIELNQHPMPPTQTAPLLLVIDDIADIRNYIELILGDSYRVIKATNGSEGYEKAMEMMPDLIISDVMMPGTDGLALCGLLKGDPRTSHIPVVLLTARQSIESQTEGYQTGADAYIVKPFNGEVLKAQVDNLLTQRQRLRQLFSQGTSIEMKKIAINAIDEAFLQKVTHLVEARIGDETFNVDTLAEMVKMSRSQFYRKIKALTNQSLQEFITILRMNKARELLMSGECNVSETAYRVGYSVPNNFTRAFAKHFGMPPSAYVDGMKGN